MVRVGVCTLAAMAMPVGAVAGASEKVPVAQHEVTHAAAAGSTVAVDDAGAELRQRLGGRADLDDLVESLSFDA